MIIGVERMVKYEKYLQNVADCMEHLETNMVAHKNMAFSENLYNLLLLILCFKIMYVL